MAPFRLDTRGLPLAQVKSIGTHIINTGVFGVAKNGSDRTKASLTVSEDRNANQDKEEPPSPRKWEERNHDISPTANETKLYLLVDDNKINLKV